MNKQIIKNMWKKSLSKYACSDLDAIRIDEEQNDIRPPFLRDSDRILYSNSYSRYKDKTQVFTLPSNDHITTRMTHIQMVSKIARTIARGLRLNEDLIEACALGHDIGHTPFGHIGEKIINEISINNKEGYFYHNVQSVRNLMSIENNGKGLNLNIQVLDGILCHNGEVEQPIYHYKEKNIDEFLKDYNDTYNDKDKNNTLVPMTLEGCVIKISDIIAYLGKDIEDAISLGIIKRTDIPQDISNNIGSTNREIINSLVLDIIKNSYNKNYIKLSNKMFNYLKRLKKFNYDLIYNNISNRKYKNKAKRIITTVFNYYLKEIDNKESKINNDFLNNMNQNYLNNTSNIRKVIDYISGMTDTYIIKEYEYIKKQKINCN